MKTIIQIKSKLAEHEKHIERELQDLRKGNMSPERIRSLINRLGNLRVGRKALQWVLSDDELIEKDDLDKKIEYEINCVETDF